MKTRHAFSLALIMCALLSFCFGPEVKSQTPASPAESITAEELRGHVFYLASDDLQGRMTGSPGLSIASVYAASQFRQAGLTPVVSPVDGDLSWFQTIGLEKTSVVKNNTRMTLSLNDKTETFNVSDDFVILSGYPYDQISVTGSAVFAGYGIHVPESGWDDFQDIDVKGKWVIMMNSIPDSLRAKLSGGYSTSERASYVYEAGAAGLIFVMRNELYRSFWPNLLTAFDYAYRMTDIESPSPAFACPVAFIDTSMVQMLFRDQPYDPLTFEGNYGSFDLHDSGIDLTKEYLVEPIACRNTVALMKGTDPELSDEYVVLGAHLDHLGVVNGDVMNGADDNGSGSAAVMEVAEAVALSKPRRSVLFVLYTGEELGLYGSGYFVRNAPVPVGQIRANVNLDMIGRKEGIGQELIVLTSKDLDPSLQGLVFAANDRTVSLPLDTIDYNNYASRSDQAPFYRAGIPYVLMSDGEHPEYHTPLDDAEKIDYEFLQQVSRLTYEVVMELANAQ